MKRFACTQCGKCCNRSPEIELSEAAPLADIFVFQLMFRVYWLPRHFRDWVANASMPLGTSAAFYERKRLLAAFASNQSRVKLDARGRVDFTRYLMISALALDTSSSRCSALAGSRCAIYERRPLTCRTVPFHYSRPEALAATDLDAFTGTPEYQCDTGGSGKIAVDGGRIALADVAAARSEAIALAKRDKIWAEAIVGRMRMQRSGGATLPSLDEVQTHARTAATTTSFAIAWRIAAEIGLIDLKEYARLIEVQLRTIDQELARADCSDGARHTLVQTRREYHAITNSLPADA